MSRVHRRVKTTLLGSAMSHNCHSFLASLLFVIAVTPPQAGAKALFDAGDIRFVGVHYWFEDSRGQKSADPASAPLGFPGGE